MRLKIRNVPKLSLVRAFREGKAQILESEFRKALDADGCHHTLNGINTLLASAFLGFIQDKGLPVPSEQTLGPLWNVVKAHLDFDESYQLDYIRPHLEALRKEFPAVIDGLRRIIELNWNGKVAGCEPVRNLGIHRYYHIQLFAHAAQVIVLHLLENAQGQWPPF
jgi:hypothetical protein